MLNPMTWCETDRDVVEALTNRYGVYDCDDPDVPQHACCLCDATVSSRDWCDATTTCNRCALPTDRIEDRAYGLAKSADRAYRTRKFEAMPPGRSVVRVRKHQRVVLEETCTP